MECSKSNGMFLKVLTINLDCEKKLIKSTFACGSPMQFSQTTFLFSQNVMTKCAWWLVITTRHRDKHFCSRSFWATNFFLPARQSSKLMLTTGCAKSGQELCARFLGAFFAKMRKRITACHEFCTLFGIHILFLLLHMCGHFGLRSHSDLDWNQVHPRNSLIQPNHDYWLLLSWILKVFWDISFSQWPRRFLTEHFL